MMMCNVKKADKPSPSIHTEYRIVYHTYECDNLKMKRTFIQIPVVDSFNAIYIANQCALFLC